MKKILFIFSLLLAVGVSKAQTDLTIVINDKVEKGYFKQDNFKWVVQGLKSSTEADNFVATIKKNHNIKTASISPAAKAGEYELSLEINSIHDVKYFKRLMYNCGVRHAYVNGKLEELTSPSVSGRE